MSRFNPDRFVYTVRVQAYPVCTHHSVWSECCQDTAPCQHYINVIAHACAATEPNPSWCKILDWIEDNPGLRLQDLPGIMARYDWYRAKALV